MMNQHFLQSEAWEKFQSALGHTTIRREGDGWSYLAIVETSGGTPRLYCPYGPTAYSLENLDKALASLKTEAKSLGAVFLRAQPFPMLIAGEAARARGMQAIQYSQPEATRRLDLTPSFEDILAQMTPSKRNVIRNYAKKGLTYHVTHEVKEVEKLLPLLRDVAAKNRIMLQDDDYIRTQAAALMPEFASFHYIELDGDVVTAALLFEGPETNYYGHAGTASKHYKLQANTALIGEMVKYSKDQGKKWLDLYGVAPNDDPKHPWAGVSNFKAEFGGEHVLYNSTYDIPLQKLRYRTYQALRSVKKRLKK